MRNYYLINDNYNTKHVFAVGVFEQFSKHANDTLLFIIKLIIDLQFRSMI